MRPFLVPSGTQIEGDVILSFKCLDKRPNQNLPALRGTEEEIVRID